MGLDIISSFTGSCFHKPISHYKLKILNSIKNLLNLLYTLSTHSTSILLDFSYIKMRAYTFVYTYIIYNHACSQYYSVA